MIMKYGFGNLQLCLKVVDFKRLPVFDQMIDVNTVLQYNATQLQLLSGAPGL